MSYYKVDDLFSTSITPGNIHSPLNYTGSKYRLLSQILPLFPKNIDTFVDLFCGGCNVGVNVKAEHYIFNDIQSELIGIYKTMINLGEREFINKVLVVIDTYKLINKRGMQEQNKDNYIKLREYTNRLIRDEEYYVNLFTLSQFSFCYQIRFNSDMEFNVPVGDTCFAPGTFDATKRFIKRLSEMKIDFKSESFTEFDYNKLTSKSFVYLDPPYLITDAVYNKYWGENEETQLLNILDSLTKRDIKWALSNVLEAKGKKNDILSEWLLNSTYEVHHLDMQYTRDNHGKGQHTHFTDEVLITNY